MCSDLMVSVLTLPYSFTHAGCLDRESLLRVSFEFILNPCFCLSCYEFMAVCLYLVFSLYITGRRRSQHWQENGLVTSLILYEFFSLLAKTLVSLLFYSGQFGLIFHYDRFSLPILYLEHGSQMCSFCNPFEGLHNPQTYLETLCHENKRIKE